MITRQNHHTQTYKTHISANFRHLPLHCEGLPCPRLSIGQNCGVVPFQHFGDGRAHREIVHFFLTRVHVEDSVERELVLGELARRAS